MGGYRLVVCDVRIDALLPQLAAVDVDEVRTRTGVAVVCPGCGRSSDWEHSRYVRHVFDEAVGGRRVVIDVSVRQLYCENPDCVKQTFVEQVNGLTVRYQRRTPALQRLFQATAVALAGSAGARLLTVMHQVISATALLGCLLAMPLPQLGTPAVIGVDDFALRRGHRYATVIIDAISHRRVDVLPDRSAETLTNWLRVHPEVEVACRDGSASYAQAITNAAPQVTQVSDRWHLWHGLGKAVEQTVAAHAACWRVQPPEAAPGSRNARVLARHAAVHERLDAGVGLGECARQLGLSLNTVKRYARVSDPDQLVRPPQYRSCLVDPYRDHLRQRRAAGPVATTTLLTEIRAMGYTGSPNLLDRYLKQGRAELDLADPSIRRLAGWILTDPDHLRADHHTHRDKLTGSCAEMTARNEHVANFAHLITTPGGDLQTWIDAVTADDLPALHSFITGLDKDRAAVEAGLRLPYSNGPTEGVNTKIKLLKRQTYGRAGFPLLRHRILFS